MKKKLISKLAVLAVIGVVYISIAAFVPDTAEIDVREKYNYLIEEINKENELFYSNPEAIIDEEGVIKHSKKVDKLKEEVYNLILENPDEFKGYIITDEEKFKGID